MGVFNNDYRDMIICLQEGRTDGTVVRKTTLEGQEDSLCLSLTPDERLRVLEELNRMCRVMAGYPENLPMNRKVVSRLERIFTRSHHHVKVYAAAHEGTKASEG